MHGEIGYHPKNNMRVSNIGRKTEVGVQEWHVHRVFERADTPQMVVWKVIPAIRRCFLDPYRRLLTALGQKQSRNSTRRDLRINDYVR